MEEPAAPAQGLAQGQPELGLLGVVHQLHDQHVVLHLEAGPDLLDRTHPDVHGVLLVELLVRVHTLLVDDYEPLLPLAQHLGLLVQSPIDEAAADEGLRDTHYFLCFVLV